MESAKTLVIHPKDTTTDFLGNIYLNHSNWTIVNDRNIWFIKAPQFNQST